MPELVCAADSPDWLTERRKGITATDITAIIGINPYESAYSLYFKKRGDIPDDHTDNDRLRLGRELEPIIIARWAEQHDIALPEQGAALWRSEDRPWQLATPDLALTRDDLLEAVVEVKSWADMDRDRWADGPPARVRAQVLWQMDTLDVATGHVGVLFLPSGEFRSYVIRHVHGKGWGNSLNTLPVIPATEPKLTITNFVCDACQDIELLREAGRDFMDRLDLNQPPSPDASSATLTALKARFTDIHHDKQAEIDAELWEHYDDAARFAAHWKDTKHGFEAMVREQAGEARTLTVNGEKVATRIVGDSEVKAHTRHSDYIRRATMKGDTDGNL